MSEGLSPQSPENEPQKNADASAAETESRKHSVVTVGGRGGGGGGGGRGGEESIDHWEPLKLILDQNDVVALHAFLELIDPSDVAYTINRLHERQRTALFSLLADYDPELAADLMGHFTDDHVADMIEELEPELAAAIVEEMDSADQADVLGELDHEDAEAILSSMDPEEAAEAEAFLAFAEDTAGGLMIDEVITGLEDQTVQQVIENIRIKAEEIDEDDYEVRFLYVVDQWQNIQGVVTMKRLILAKPHRKITDLMIGSVQTVHPSTPLEELEVIFDHVGYSAIPVVDREGRLLGVVQRHAVHEALAEQGDEKLAKVGGIIGGEELRSMPVWARAGRRLLFLAPIGMLMVFSTSVILLFEGTITKLPAIAAILPLIGGICGSGGGQAVAVSMRELSLGLLKPKDVMYVFRKELLVALINGLALGLMLFAFVSWKNHSVWVGLVPGLAMVLVLPIAVCVGGVAPIVLKRIGIDPAMASVPAVTTIVDLTSFFTTLTIATLAMKQLVNTGM